MRPIEAGQRQQTRNGGRRNFALRPCPDHFLPGPVLLGTQQVKAVEDSVKRLALLARFVSLPCPHEPTDDLLLARHDQFEFGYFIRRNFSCLHGTYSGEPNRREGQSSFRSPNRGPVKCRRKAPTRHSKPGRRPGPIRRRTARTSLAGMDAIIAASPSDRIAEASTRR